MHTWLRERKTVKVKEDECICAGSLFLHPVLECVCAPPCRCVYKFSQTHFGSAMSCQSKSKGSAWCSEVASTLSPASPRSSITGERAKMRANIHKQAGKAFAYMQTSLILFLCDPRPFQNNTNLTRALFVTYPSTSSSRLPFKCLLTYYFYVFTPFLMCLISVLRTRPADRVGPKAATAQTSPCPKSLDMSLSLDLPPTFLTSLPSTIHPPTPSLLPPLAPTATPSPSHKE